MRCPVCKAENATGPSCRRCRADLSLLWQLEGRRERALAEARQRLATGAWRQATDAAAEADRLRNGEDARRLLAAAHLMSREFARAWACYQDGTAEEEASPDQ